MLRNIPPVRVWRVTYYRDGKQILRVDTLAPNKQFARWNARDEFIQSGVWRDGLAERVTVSVTNIPHKLERYK
jgi:hypothetical protein